MFPTCCSPRQNIVLLPSCPPLLRPPFVPSTFKNACLHCAYFVQSNQGLYHLSAFIDPYCKTSKQLNIFEIQICFKVISKEKGCTWISFHLPKQLACLIFILWLSRHWVSENSAIWNLHWPLTDVRRLKHGHQEKANQWRRGLLLCVSVTNCPKENKRHFNFWEANFGRGETKQRNLMKCHSGDQRYSSEIWRSSVNQKLIYPKLPFALSL